MFNEKIYLFLWWWFLIVAIVTILNFFYWLVISIVKSMQLDFVNSYLRVYMDLENQNAVDKRTLERFVDTNLRPDGIFLLRMIAANAGHIVATSLVGALWKLAQERRQPKPPFTNASSPEKEHPVDLSDPGFEENLYEPGKRSPDGKPLLSSQNGL